MNSEDIDALSAVLADDLEFLDARGQRIVGKANALEMARRLFDSGIEYRLQVGSVARVGGQLLMRGKATSNEPAFCNDLLWRVHVSGRQIDFWETHGSQVEQTLLQALVPDLVQRSVAA